MARILDKIIGHQKKLEFLLQALAAEHLPQTFLFVGPQGVGKKLSAIGMAQALLCEKKTTACGECSSCLRVEHLHHESLLLVEPEKNIIKIEQAREVLNFLSLKSLSPRRVIIFDHAEALNPQAANSLLKALEEPSPDTYFFLIAPSSSHVLPTIRSRSQIITFQSLTSEEMRQKVRAEEWMLRAAQGSFQKLAAMNDVSEKEARQSAIFILQKSVQNPKALVETEIKDVFRDKGQSLSVARHLSFLLRDAVIWQTEEHQNLINPDQTGLFSSLSERPREKLLKAAQKSLELERELLQNRDSQLLFEQFWIEHLC